MLLTIIMEKFIKYIYKQYFIQKFKKISSVIIWSYIIGIYITIQNTSRKEMKRNNMKN